MVDKSRFDCFAPLLSLLQSSRAETESISLSVFSQHKSHGACYHTGVSSRRLSSRDSYFGILFSHVVLQLRGSVDALLGSFYFLSHQYLVFSTCSDFVLALNVSMLFAAKRISRLSAKQIIYLINCNKYCRIL